MQALSINAQQTGKEKKYCGLTFDWEYDKRYVDIPMPGYVPESLKQLGHHHKQSVQYSPHKHVPKSMNKRAFGNLQANQIHFHC